MKNAKPKSRKALLSRFSLIFLMLVSVAGNAQTPTNIGIGTTTPDISAVLHLNSLTQGFLLPRFTNGGIAAIASPADGLLIYNTDKKEFQYWNNTAWQTFPSWQQNGNDIHNSNTGKVGIGTATPATALQVVGTVTATDYALTGANANGPVPKGGIILWSGAANAIPSGWALCDGANGTPNLRGRFVPGAGPGSYAVGNTGGADAVTLNLTQIPSHSHNGTTSTDGFHDHDYWDYYQDDESDGGGGAATKANETETQVLRTSAGNGSHSHTFTTSAEGGGGAHENRPPYYALCYIMKL